MSLTQAQIEAIEAAKARISEKQANQLSPEQAAAIDAVLQKNPDLATSQHAQPEAMPVGTEFDRYYEAAKTMATAPIGYVAGGWAGLLNLHKGLDQARFAQQYWQDAFTNTPETQQGVDGVQVASNYLNDLENKAKAGMAVPHLIAGNMSQSMGGPDAVDYYKAVGLDKGSGQALGDLAFELSGSPGFATFMYTTPTIIAELVGLKGFAAARPGVKMLDEFGEPTKALQVYLEEQGFDLSTMSEAAKSAISDIAAQNMRGTPALEGPAQEAMKQSLKDGSAGDAYAELKLVDGRIKPNKKGLNATKNGFERGVVARVETATPETRKGMREILKIFRKTKANHRYLDTHHPAEVVGRSGVKRLDFLKGKLDESRKIVQGIVKNEFPNKFVDVTPVVRAFKESLDEMGVTLESKGYGRWTPNFDLSLITKNPASKKAVDDIIDLLNETGNQPVSGERLHRIKIILDDLTYQGKAQQTGISKEGVNMFKHVRRAIKESLEGLSDDYATHNKRQHEILQLFEDMDASTVSSIDIFGPVSEARLGLEMRKIMSNYQNKFGLIDATNSLNQMAEKHGGKFNDSMTDLAHFVVDMNARFKAMDKTSLEGIVQRVADGQLAATAATMGAEAAATQAAGGFIKRAWDKRFGKTDYDAFRAMEQLLKD